MGDLVTVETLTAAAASAALPGLTGVLEDAVDGGASVGFLPPLAPGEALAYWESVVDAVARGATALLVARRDGEVAGTRLGDESERLYRACGWTFVGSIPRYARSASGTLDANAIYSLLLE